MKKMINKIQLLILVMSLASTGVIAQTIPKDSTKTDTLKTKADSTKAKVVAKIDTIKKDVKVAVDKVIDKVTPSKPTEVATVNTPKGALTLTADPTSDAVFHKGSLVIGAGIVYQKDLLPLMIVDRKSVV